MYYMDCIQDLANLENGKFQIEKDFFQMRKNLNDVLTMLEAQLGNRNIKIQFFCNNNVPDLIYSDVKRIKQVLYQLLSNSIKYTPRGVIEVIASVTDTMPISGIDSPDLVR